MTTAEHSEHPEHPYSICRGTRVFENPADANMEWPGKITTVADRLQSLIEEGRLSVEQVAARQKGDTYALDRGLKGDTPSQFSDWWLMKVGGVAIGWIPQPAKNPPCREKAPAKRAREEIEYGQGIFGKAFFPGVEEGTKIISLKLPERKKIRRRSGSGGRPKFGQKI